MVKLVLVDTGIGNGTRPSCLAHVCSMAFTIIRIAGVRACGVAVMDIKDEMLAVRKPAAEIGILKTKIPTVPDHHHCGTGWVMSSDDRLGLSHPLKHGNGTSGIRSPPMRLIPNFITPNIRLGAVVIGQCRKEAKGVLLWIRECPGRDVLNTDRVIVEQHVDVISRIRGYNVVKQLQSNVP